MGPIGSAKRNGGGARRGDSRPAIRGLLPRGGYWTFFGPAIMTSVAYIDPGNFGTDIAAGAGHGYLLLWSVVLANLMAMLFQYLSGKLGWATGRSLAALVRERLGSRPKIVAYWLASETFAVATDLAEFLGVTLAIHLLFGIPLLYAAWISAFDVLLIFGLAGPKLSRLRLIISAFVAAIGLGYLYEIMITKPSWSEVLAHALVPTLQGSEAVLLVVGVIGATVMPHALVVHSWLTAKKATQLNESERSGMLGHHRLDTILNFTMAGLINAAIMMMAAAAFHANGIRVATVEEAYLTLKPLFGISAAIIFALTLLFSGLSSSTVGVLAGQALLEDLLGSKLNVWVRRIIIRVVNVVPTSIAIMAGAEPLLLLVYSQVVLSLLIPVPLVPLLILSSDRRVMGPYANSRPTKLAALLCTALVLWFNAYLLLLAVTQGASLLS